MATKHTREDRYRAAAAFVVHSNSRNASEASGIPASTIRHWSQHDEDFQLMCQEIKSEFGEKIKYQFAEIIDESARQTLDRLINGDVVRDTKTGEQVRIPIKGKDAAIIGAVAFDKLRLAENQPTNIVHHENAEAHIQGLVTKFKTIAEANHRGDYDEVDRLVRRLGGTPAPGIRRKEDS